MAALAIALAVTVWVGWRWHEATKNTDDGNL